MIPVPATTQSKIKGIKGQSKASKVVSGKDSAPEIQNRGTSGPKKGHVSAKNFKKKEEKKKIELCSILPNPCKDISAVLVIIPY